MKLTKLLCLAFFLLIISLVVFPFIQDPEVPLSIKILHYRYKLLNFYSGGSLNKTFIRANVDQYNKFFSSPPIHSNNTYIEHLLIPSFNDSHQITVNIYVNKTLLQASENNRLPTIVYIHGGGWVYAPPEGLFYERFTTKGIVFIEIRYRLSPEAKFPIPLNDCYSAIMNKELYKYSDIERIAIMGDSAGANLVEAVLFLLRDRGQSDIYKLFKYQLLIYPATGTLEEFESTKKYHNWYIIGRERMEFFTYSYADKVEDLENPYLNLLKQTNLKDLPNSYVVLSERDYLYSEGEEYTKRLNEAGNKIVVNKYQIEHSFFRMGLDVSLKALEDLIRFLREEGFLL